VKRLAIFGLILAVTSACAIGPLWEPSRQQLLERMVPSAVQIVLERDGQRYRSGSGVVIAMQPSAEGPNCFVLTSGHTLSRRSTQDKVYVLFGRDHGPGTKIPATVVAHHDDEEMDLSLLRAQSKECFPAQFGQPPELGVPIWVLAYPWGRNMTLVAGIVSQVNVDRPGNRETAPRFIVDASVSYGSSGGGVYDGQTGRLVGIVEGYRTARVSFQVDASQQYIDMPVPGETYVVPLTDIRRFLLQADRKDLLGQLPMTTKTQK
jgi:serine protease Do